MVKQVSKKELKELSRLILALENEGNIANFLTDLCTPDELNSLIERWNVAQLVNKGLSYRAINDKTSVSTATITRVARSLNLGSGYKKAIEIHNYNNIKNNNDDI